MTFAPYELDRPRGLPQGTLLCLPGLNSGAYIFTGARDMLPHWDVVRFATPGVAGVPLPLPFSAKSYAEHVVKHLHAHGPLVSPVVVVGHSLGGFAAQELVRLGVLPISRLVLVSTSRGQPDTIRDLQQMERAMGMNFWQFSKLLEEQAAQGLRPLFGPQFPEHNPAIYQHFVAQRAAALPSTAATMAQLSAGGIFSSRRWLKTLNLPTLVMHGTGDILISHASGRALAESLPHGRLLSLYNVGHFPMLETPTFWKHVADFCHGATLGNRVEPLPSWRGWLRTLWERQG